MTTERINHGNWLPFDGIKATLVGRAWVPGSSPGPAVVVLRDDEVFDISEDVWTLSELFEAGVRPGLTSECASLWANPASSFALLLIFWR